MTKRKRHFRFQVLDKRWRATASEEGVLIRKVHSRRTRFLSWAELLEVMDGQMLMFAQ